VGTGRAAKPQVQEMVKRLLRLNRAPGTDASDALGVAICAAHHAQMPKAIIAALAPKLAPKKRSK
jgi:crossover junction endodeoxyribonuclease RuvC